MNDEQKRLLEIAIESHRRTLDILQNKEFMEGVFESWEAVQRGEKGIPGKDLKRKYEKRA
jgi:hypothetical protein